MKLKVSHAILVSLAILMFLVLFIKGSEVAFGITTGWMFILCVSVFFLGEGIPTKEGLKRFVCGSLYGLIFGQFFALFIPVFILSILVLLFCRFRSALPLVMNDYALTMISVYTITDVARPHTVWQDLLIFAITVFLIFIICTVIEKKAMPHLGQTGSRNELSAEEKARPYAKYYERELTAPKPELEKAARKVISPVRAMPITEIRQLLNKDAPFAETGYCIMPDGSGYVAARQFLPGVTPEMMEWWGAWHPQEDLRYKLWFYPGHKRIWDKTPEGKVVTTDMPAGIAGRQSFGKELLMVEDTGMGDEYVSIEFLTPEQMGFDVSEMESGDIVFMSGGNGQSWNMEGIARKIPAVVLHVAYEADGGLIIQSHFWMGWRFEEGKPVLAMAPQTSIPIFGPKALIDHCVHEFANLGAILPELYKEENS